MSGIFFVKEGEHCADEGSLAGLEYLLTKFPDFKDRVLRQYCIFFPIFSLLLSKSMNIIPS